MHKSQAFAAYRTALVADLLNDITTELLPAFNSEVEDIRIQYEDIKLKKGPALADHHKRARVLDLKTRQQDFITSLNAEMSKALTERVLAYGGTIETRKDEKDNKKEVLEAKFPDGSVARVPKSLWVNYEMFARV